MPRAVAVLYLVALLGCASTPPQPQEILRGQMPKPFLQRVLEVNSGRWRGLGAPINGSRILTAYHVVKDAPQTPYWTRGPYKGDLKLITYNEKKDLALLQSQELIMYQLEISDRYPAIGEEVYWAGHQFDGDIIWLRGWYIGADTIPTKAGKIKSVNVDGWFHPGMSGSPILRADGTFFAIATAGINWSCGIYYPKFMELKLRDQLSCLYKMNMFPPMMVGVGVVGDYQ